MGKILKALSLFLFSTYISYSQKLQIDFTRMIGGMGFDGVNDALYDPRDNSIVFVGYTIDSCGTGDLPPCQPYLGHRNVLIGKVDANRNLMWLKVYGGTQADNANSITISKDGGYAVLCTTLSNDGDVVGNHGTDDYWLLKIDNGGDLEWQKCYGSYFSQQASHIQQTKDGGYLMAGQSAGSGGDDVPPQYSSSEFVSDWLLIKVDNSGNKEWARIIGGTKHEGICRSFEIGNNIYLAGSSESRNYNCNDTSWRVGKNTEDDFFLVKLDDTGGYIWNKSYGGSSYDQLDDVVWDDRDSTFVLAGHTFSANYHVPAGDVSENVWLLKLDLNGNLVWSKVLGDNSSEWYVNIEKSPYSNGYIVSCRADVSKPIPPYYYCDVNGQNNRLFLIDNLGNVLIDQVIGGTVSEFNSIPVNISKDFIVVGESASPMWAEGKMSPLHGKKQDIYISYIQYWPTSIPAKYVSDSFEMYPNPAKSTVTIDLRGVMEEGNLVIYDIAGKVIQQRSFGKGSRLTISTQGWSDGVYIVSIKTKNGNTIKKLTTNK